MQIANEKAAHSAQLAAAAEKAALKPAAAADNAEAPGKKKKKKKNLAEAAAAAAAAVVAAAGIPVEAAAPVAAPPAKSASFSADAFFKLVSASAKPEEAPAGAPSSAVPVMPPSVDQNELAAKAMKLLPAAQPLKVAAPLNSFAPKPGVPEEPPSAYPASQFAFVLSQFRMDREPILAAFRALCN